MDYGQIALGGANSSVTERRSAMDGPKTSLEDLFDFPIECRRLEPADIVTGPLPVAACQMYLAGCDELIGGLQQLLKENPELLKLHGLAEDPWWLLPCPDGSVLEIGAYGYREDGCVRGQVLEVFGWEPPANSDHCTNPCYCQAIPAEKMRESLRLLLAANHMPPHAPQETPLIEPGPSSVLDGPVFDAHAYDGELFEL